MGNYIGPDPSVQKDTQNRVTYIAADGQTTFAAMYTPGYIDVYQNGIKLQNTDFTASTGTTFTLGTACVVGDVVECVAIKASSPYDFYTRAQADLRSDNFYGVALGSGDAMTVTLTPTPTSLVDGMSVKVRAPSSNTITNPSLTIMGLGVSKTIYKLGGQALYSTEYFPGQELHLRYNLTGDRFELINLSNFIPVGTVIHVPYSSPPPGFLKANGASLLTASYSSLFSVIGYTFGGSGGSFNVMDLRGEFIRGWDDSRSVDTGRVLGSAQTDALKSHTHPIPGPETFGAGLGGGVYVNDALLNSKAGNGTSGASGGTETRPRNIALLACIKY